MLPRAHVLVSVALLSVCSCARLVANTAGSALAGTSVMASDDDPELIRAAAPFGLKTLEALLAKSPENLDIIAALASGYTSYATAFVIADAESAELQGRIVEQQRSLSRARKLLERAREYALRGLDIRHPGLAERMKQVVGIEKACAVLTVEDVPLAYWAAASWGLLISTSRSDARRLAELPVPGALILRAIELNPTWDRGALYAFLISYDRARPGITDSEARAHYEKAISLADGKRLSDQVAWAEGAMVTQQNRMGFETLLQSVVAADASRPEDMRLANTVAKRRAAELLTHVDDIFSN